MEAPGSEEEAAALVRAAHDAGEPLAIVGGDTRSGLGRPVQAARTVSSRGLTGITAYEPAEMVLSARAGTGMNEIEAALRENRQRLAFEPIDHRTLYGTRGEPTIGGVAATNASGSRRFQAGAARDSLLGVRFVNGRGEIVRGGGRVMKNVTGLDLPKVMAGSFGTLGLLTEVTFKVAPVPETQATLMWRNIEPERAVELLAAAMATTTEPSGAAWASGSALLRLEGLSASVQDRTKRLEAALSSFGASEILEDEESAALWRDVTDVAAFPPAEGGNVWRISVAPLDGPKVAAGIEGDAVLDWQGGLVWLRTDGEPEAVRQALAPFGGHATLARADETVRSAVPVFQPQDKALTALEKRLRGAFDPKGIMNPGRMG